MKSSIVVLAIAAGLLSGRARASSDLVFEPAYFAEAAPTTAYDMVRRVPGFVIDAGDAVRGYAGAAGNILVDGARPSTKNGSIDTVLKAIPAGQVARIELIRTARPGLDQQGTQALVNVVRVADVSSVHAFTLSNYAYPDGTARPALRGEISRRMQAGGWEASLLLSTNQDESGTGQRVRRAASGETLERADITLKSPIRGAEARLAADLPVAGGTARGNVSLAHQDYRTHEIVDFTEGPDAGETARTDDRIRTSSGEVGAEWSRSFDKALTAKLLFLATRKDTAIRSTSDDGGIASDYAGNSVADERILRATLDRAPPGGLGWEIGAEAAYNALGSRSRLSIEAAPVALPNADVKISEWRGDVSGKLKLPVLSRVSAEAVLRGELSSLGQKDRISGKDYARTFGFLKPKLGVQWDAGRRDQLRLRVEREVGQLDFADFASSASLLEGTVDAGNAELRPQTAWVFEAAAERRFGKDGMVSIAYRHERIDNVLDLLPIDGFDAPGNIGRGRVDAVAVRLTWPLDGIGVSGGRVSFDGEWRRSRVEDPVTGKSRGITALAPFEGEIHASLDRPALRSTFALDVYFGQTLTYRRINEVRRTRDAPYVSLQWIYNAAPGLTVETSATNILFRKRERDRSTYDGPRSENDLLHAESRSYRSRGGLFLSIRYQN